MSGGRIEQIRGEGYNGDSGRERPQDDSVCLGVFEGQHCPVRVSCLRYQSLKSDSTDFVRIEELRPNGCDKYLWIMPGDQEAIVAGLKHVETPDDYLEWR